MDHTFTGIMFDVKAHDLPFEYLEITSVWLRGRLGPIGIWSTPNGFRGKHEQQEQWEQHYDKFHRPSPARLAEMRLSSPIRLRPKETRGLYAHAACRGDEQIVYDNQRHRTSLTDMHLDILPGLAHLSDEPFSPNSQFVGWWGPPWRERREFVGRLSYGVRWLRWNPEVAEDMPPLFRQMVWAILMSRHRRSQQSLLYWLTEDHILYILNSIEWWACPAMQEDLNNLLYPPKPSITAKMGAVAAAGAKTTGNIVSAKSRSVFKRFAASVAGLIKRGRGGAPDAGTTGDHSGPPPRSPESNDSPCAADSTAAMFARSTAAAVGVGLLAAAGSMPSGYGT